MLGNKTDGTLPFRRDANNNNRSKRLGLRSPDQRVSVANVHGSRRAQTGAAGRVVTEPTARMRLLRAALLLLLCCVHAAAAAHGPARGRVARARARWGADVIAVVGWYGEDISCAACRSAAGRLPSAWRCT
jgi:hypothetical protein